ncbi:MAG: hypothetical protein ABJB05_08180 [Parafilimonas sp.]
MGFLNFFEKRRRDLDTYLPLIQSQILNINEFQNFKISNNDYQNELYEFKKFITILIAGCLYSFKVKQHLNIKNFQIRDSIYQKIFKTVSKQAISFYKNFVQNDKLIIGLFNNEIYKNHNGVIADIMGKFGKYSNEIEESFKTNKSHWGEEYETKEYDEEYQCYYSLTGRIYFEFIRLLFLSTIEKTENNKLKIEEADIWLTEYYDQFDDITSSFVKSLAEITNGIKVESEMLSN